MIEVTNEMVCALNENWPMGVARGEGMRLGLAAVLAIVQRDHVILPRGAQALCCGDHPDVPTRWGVCPACVALAPDEDRA